MVDFSWNSIITPYQTSGLLQNKKIFNLQNIVRSSKICKTHVYFSSIKYASITLHRTLAEWYRLKSRSNRSHPCDTPLFIYISGLSYLSIFIGALCFQNKFIISCKSLMLKFFVVSISSIFSCRTLSKAFSKSS